MGSCSAKQALQVSTSIIETLHTLLDSNQENDFNTARKLIMDLSDPDKINRYSKQERDQIYALMAKLLKAQQQPQ
jgi:hypothetical protein